MASLTRRFVSAKRVFRDFSEFNSKLVEHRAQSPVRKIQDDSSLTLYRCDRRVSWPRRNAASDLPRTIFHKNLSHLLYIIIIIIIIKPFSIFRECVVLIKSSLLPIFQAARFFFIGINFCLITDILGQNPTLSNVIFSTQCTIRYSRLFWFSDTL